MNPRHLKIGTLITLPLMLIVVIGVWARPADARVVHDFAPPLSESAAQASVALANARNTVDRAVISQQIGLSNPLALPSLQTVYFEQTGHHLSNRSGFLDYWRANGQTLIFGYPISEEIVENGLIVQYFERARFEFHPAQSDTPAQVKLGLIGQEMLAYQGMPEGIPDPQNGARYFPETQHTLWGEFLKYWERRGGMDRFGFPLSEVVEENGRQVQYFERVKMEYHPEDMAGFFRSMESANGFDLDTLFEVRLSDLGRQLATTRGINTSPAAQLPGAALWHPAIWSRHIDVDLTSQWLTAYEGDLVVYRAPIATGRDGFNTPTGEYAIYYRLPMQTMSGCMGGECWNVPNIPWVQYVVGGVALHGTYWHDAHGTGVRMSHGCVNLRIDDAQWLYEWADIGTTVSIHY